MKNYLKQFRLFIFAQICNYLCIALWFRSTLMVKYIASYLTLFTLFFHVVSLLCKHLIFYAYLTFDIKYCYIFSVKVVPKMESSKSSPSKTPLNPPEEKKENNDEKTPIDYSSIRGKVVIIYLIVLSNCESWKFNIFHHLQKILISPTEEQYDLLQKQLVERIETGRGEVIYEIGISEGNKLTFLLNFHFSTIDLNLYVILKMEPKTEYLKKIIMLPLPLYKLFPLTSMHRA